jgi:hypothetical protein
LDTIAFGDEIRDGLTRVRTENVMKINVLLHRSSAQSHQEPLGKRVGFEGTSIRPPPRDGLKERVFLGCRRSSLS